MNGFFGPNFQFEQGRKGVLHDVLDVDQLAQRLRLMINFGFAGYDDVVCIGTNGKMNEACAAMGLASMRSMADVVERNRRNHAAYARELADIPGMQLLQYPGSEKGNYQYIVAEYQAPAGSLSRDQLIDVLWAENVIARRYFHPGCHRMEPYRTLFPDVGRRLPATEAITDRLLVLPTGSDIHDAEIAAITGVMRTAVRGGAGLVAALRARH